MSFFMGVINVLLTAAAILLIRRVKPIVYWLLISISISIFLMNFRSSFIWANFPFLPYFQFPWRFLSLITFATSALVIVFDKVKYGKVIGLVIIVSAIALNFSYFKPHDFLGRTDEYFTNRYIPFPVASEEYKKTGEEYLRLPNATEVRPDKVSPNPGLDATFNVDYQKETKFNYYKYYFPGWRAKVDGKDVVIAPGSPYGQITFAVPSGRHYIEVYFKETLFRRVLDIVSVGALVFVIYLLI
jgi:hypothetical protein